MVSIAAFSFAPSHAMKPCPTQKKSCGYNEGMECDPAMKNERCLVLIQEGVQ